MGLPVYDIYRNCFRFSYNCLCIFLVTPARDKQTFMSYSWNLLFLVTPKEIGGTSKVLHLLLDATFIAMVFYVIYVKQHGCILLQYLR